MSPETRANANASRTRTPGHRTGAADGRRSAGSGRRSKNGPSPERVEPLDLPPLEPALFINRELSWLEFNRRVLEEAADPATPLLERVKFVAIFASNLDEWFMIRVAGVKRKVTAGVGDPGPDGRTPSAQLSAIRHLAQHLLDQQVDFLTGTLLPDLAREGVEIRPYAELDAEAKAGLAERFEREFFPVLTPQAIDRGRRFPHISNRSLNLIASLRLPSGESRFARVKIPATLPRLVPLPPPPAVVDNGRSPAATGAEPWAERQPYRFTWLEDVVAAHLDRLFTGARIEACYPFHVTRDSDIELDEDEDADDREDLMMVMRESISQRAFGPVVRLMVGTAMPAEIRDWLVENLHASERDLYVVDGPLALEDLFELTSLDRPDLKDPPLVPATVAELAPTPGGPDCDVFAVLRDRDVMVHHPYQSFGTVVDFVRAASTDPDVVAIKQTLYRIGRDSPLVPALIEARDDDTQVAVLVELKARFDEENNITWAEQLEQHGVHVAFGLMGLKTHCKATLVVRREPDGLRRYVHLATGNYNATTARVYEDIGLLSAREELGRDVSELFNALTGYAAPPTYSRLWVAPTHLRQQVIDAIAREVAVHRRDGNGHLIFKVNALVDRTIIRALYAASRAGVKIDLIVRGPCCLRPGVRGWSDTINVVSLVGRFLEHSRIYAFRNGGAWEVYLGSADLMERNLDRRVEVVFPVDDPGLSRHLHAVILPAYLRDTVNARRLLPDGSYEPVRPAAGEAPFDVQTWLLEYYRGRREGTARAAAGARRH